MVYCALRRPLLSYSVSLQCPFQQYLFRQCLFRTQDAKLAALNTLHPINSSNGAQQMATSKFTTSKLSTSKKVGNLLASSASGLQHLLEKAAILDQLTRDLCDALTPPLNQHVSVANIRQNTLVIAADSPAWITKARYQAPVILKLIRQKTGLKQLTKIHFKVINTQDAESEHYSRQPNMTEGTSLLLESTAKGVTDPALKAAIRRLSRNAT